MDKRLNQIYNMLPESGTGIIDIGTDHGLIPIRLAMEGYPGTIIATDIAEGPLKTAVRNAEEKGVRDRIRFMICDGLDYCPVNEIDCILISGMGGDSICDILDRAEWLQEGQYKLVLQPMTRQEVLRYWLVNNGFQITEEALVYDKKHSYQILSAVPGQNREMKDAEYLVGSKAVTRQGEDVSRLIDEQIEIIRKKLNGQNLASMNTVSCRRFYEAICRELEEMFI